MDFDKYLAVKKQLIESELSSLIPANNKIPVITEAMTYSLFAGGKRLRPILSLMACELFGGAFEEVLPFACCIEMIHAYSLIHDDLPAMDNDDMRRGKPTNHKVFGEGFAILAGDALLNQAFEIMIGIIARNPRPEYIRAADIICKSAGVSGMIGGQCLDIYYENKSIDFDTLKNMHSKKTGAIIAASLGVGAILSGADEEDIANIMAFGDLIGLAFQVTDDILDVSGSEKELGKSINKDVASHKSNFVTFYGLQESRGIAKDLIIKAKLRLDAYGDKGLYLYELSDYIINRSI